MNTNEFNKLPKFKQVLILSKKWKISEQEAEKILNGNVVKIETELPKNRIIYGY